MRGLDQYPHHNRPLDTIVTGSRSKDKGMAVSQQAPYLKNTHNSAHRGQAMQ